MLNFSASRYSVFFGKNYTIKATSRLAFVYFTHYGIFPRLSLALIGNWTICLSDAQWGMSQKQRRTDLQNFTGTFDHFQKQNYKLIPDICRSPQKSIFFKDTTNFRKKANLCSDLFQILLAKI